ncbi:MAG: phosphoribosylamine--glycine ligase [Phycisphaerales bacterium]
MNDAGGSVNVLLVGGGGREHALAWKLRQSPRLGKLYLTDANNPGLAGLGEYCGSEINYARRDYFGIRRFCQLKSVGLVVIGPEEPLAAGLADALREPVMPGVPVPLVFGPTRQGAMLEADKAWSKELMRSASIPTAEARIFNEVEAARTYMRSRKEPHVVKAAGLAKGKGVVVPASIEEGVHAIDSIMLRKEFGDAGRTVVIEEKLQGREVSVFALVDGQNIFMLEVCQDHKRLQEGAKGPNTGGMGAVCPPHESATLDEAFQSRLEREILVPTVDALRREEIDYRGVIYVGLMLTPGGPKVIEYNARFGDPECQVLMMRIRCDLVEVLSAAASGTLHKVDLSWSPTPAVCVVLASGGYPEKPRTGVPIRGLDEAAKVEGVQIFHAGTARDREGNIVTAGGRVLNVAAVGATIEEARARAAEAAEMIVFEGKQWRGDIGTAVIG